ncbi:MAG: TolC family protein [Sandaracinaceae bacterium]|nr:TolC family protein [Sandaracinaceae bacterium]
MDVEAVLRGEGRGLTADDAARLAVETAPGVDRARAAQRQASAGAMRAMVGFIPQLTLTARYTRLSEIRNGGLTTGPTIDPATIPAIVAGVDDPDARFLWEQTLTAQADLANYTFPVILDQFAFQASLAYAVSDVILQVLPAYESARSREAAARLQVQVQEREIGLQAREAFYQYARARGALAVAQSSLTQAESRHAQVQAFVEAGTSAPVDELRLRAQVAATRVAVVRAEAGVRVAGTALGTLMHLEPDTDVAVGEDLLTPMPPIEGTVEQLVSRALAARDDVRAVRRIIEAADHAVDAAEGSRYPHVLVQGNLDVANPNQRIFPQTSEFRESWDVSAILRWSPHDLLNGEAQADEARAQRDSARADLRALQDGIRLSVTEAATTHLAALTALEAARLGVEAADESYRVTMERYRAGAATVSDTIDSSAEQVRAQLDLVNAAIDSRIAHARLHRAIGASEQ